MKNLLICLIILALPLVAEQVSLGMVTGVKGNSLILTDGLEVPVGRSVRYVFEDEEAADMTSITFPFTASLIIDTEQPLNARARTTLVKIHKFYDLVDGRLIQRQSR